MTSLSDSPTLSAKSNLEQTSKDSPATQEPLIINGMVVPTGPRAERVGTSADPFVTPTRGIETSSPSRPRDSATVAGSELQAHITPTPSGFTPRPDRLAEVITADNAQAIYPPQACIFVANLSTQCTDEQIQKACESKFGAWGPCHAKVHRDKNRMPYAFVQFHEIEDARVAIRESKGLIIDGRPIRAEHANADRAVLLTRHTGGPITDGEARSLLEKYGAIEETCPISVGDQKVTNLPEGRWVKFAFFQDCQDARLAFKHDEYYQLVMHRPEARAPANAANRSSPRSFRPSGRVHNRSVYGRRWVPDEQAVFVGDLPFDVVEDEIREALSPYGHIQSVDILRKDVENGTDMRIFAFVGFDNTQSVEDALSADTYLRGYRIRVERKEYTMRRNMRMGLGPHSPRYLDPILVHLYNQGLQMGLPQDQAVRILHLSRRPRVASGYANPMYGSPAPRDASYGSSLAPYGSSPYHPQPGNTEYQQFTGPQQGNAQYQQLATPQPENVEHQESAAPQAPEQYGQFGSTNPMSTATSQVMTESNVYHADPKQPSQAMAQYGTMPIEPIFGAGYSYNYPRQPNTLMIPIPEATPTEHRFSHEVYGPNTYANEAYGPENYPSQPDYGHGHGYH
ncbi:hypothetical protein GJ744_003626 [Endocarpon pusillum]|uniref:RRM domain-containing protein n=1 Tax=Endocarpon pusillum TaxID=364733 RepID=A0A8H7A6P6_9EURO|nr:hypothetical protein GJ744_003626 [Endocarpon pusillum]